MFKSRKLILLIFLTAAGLLTAIMTFWEMLGTVWTPWDFPALGFLYRTLLNNQHGLLDQRFAREWPLKEAFGVLVFMSIFLAFAATLKSSWMLYLMGMVLACSLAAYAGLEFMRFSLFPIISLGSSFLFLFLGLLASRNLAIAGEQKFIRNLFARRSPEHAVQHVLAQPECLQLNSEEKTLTVMFAGVAGFTTLTESVPLHALKKLLNDYFTEMTDIIIAGDGLVDKFMGATFMAEFGALLPASNHAEQAVRAALKMQRRLLDLQQQWARQGLPLLQCRIGINTGPVLIGNMGAREIVDYTVLGEAVNFAARLERLNKIYGTSLLVSEATHAQLSPLEFRARLLDMVKTRSNAATVKIYEVHGDLATYRSKRDAVYYQTYQQAFEAFLQRDFTSAREKFSYALSLYPEDPASKILLERMASLLSNGAPENWDGTAA